MDEGFYEQGAPLQQRKDEGSLLEVYNNLPQDAHVGGPPDQSAQARGALTMDKSWWKSWVNGMIGRLAPRVCNTEEEDGEEIQVLEEPDSTKIIPFFVNRTAGRGVGLSKGRNGRSEPYSSGPAFRTSLALLSSRGHATWVSRRWTWRKEDRRAAI